jgi:acyl carrier protein
MIEERIRRYIIEKLGFDGPIETLTDEYPLIKNRVLDSMAIFQLVTFLEAEYDIQIDDEELVPEHFGTLTSIARLINQKRA